MSEADAIGRIERPATVASLTTDLQRLGIETGDVIIVHSSLSALGWTAGGAQAVVHALMSAVGAAGTVVMPTQSGQLSDPADWSQPSIPAEWIDEVRASLPAYDPHLTPTRSMGQVVDCFRNHPGTLRSSHPLLSFAANGPLAPQIVDEHPLSPGFGESSPLARLYELDAKVLLLGVGHGNNTSLHLAESRAEWHGKAEVAQSQQSAPLIVDGARQWVTWTDLEANEDDFDQIGEALAATDIETVGPVGAGSGRLSRQRTIVDFAVDWISDNRPGSLPVDSG